MLVHVGYTQLVKLESYEHPTLWHTAFCWIHYFIKLDANVQSSQLYAQYLPCARVVVNCSMLLPAGNTLYIFAYVLFMHKGKYMVS